MRSVFAIVTAVRVAGLASLAALAAAPGPALAHAFGARYDLPIPLWLWVSGAGAAVGLSFVLVALVLPERHRADRTRRFELTALPGLGVLAHPAVRGVVRVFSVLVFVLIVIAGLVGNQAPTKNIAPVLVWVIWWVGLAYVAALAGNLWRLVNPWAILFEWAEALFVLVQRKPRDYPAWLGAWPAVALFFVFAWLEIVSSSGEVPARLAGLIIVYSAITWAGMWIYGRETWLARAEAFSLCFGLLSRFAIIEGTPAGGSARPALWLRPPAVGLLVDRPVAAPIVAFAILLLATVSFDGIAETAFWAAVLDWFAENRMLRPLLIDLQAAGVDLVQLIRTLGLIAAPLGFAAVFLIFSWLTARAGGGDVSAGRAAGMFVLSLVPIAIAYHLSHYFSYLMLAGQLVIPLASDPLGLGWDLFGTAARGIDISVVSARMVLYLSTIAIVAGHVAAVYLGHVSALRLFADRRAARRSQIPHLCLMVAYSMLSLWILSQPVVETS